MTVKHSNGIPPITDPLGRYWDQPSVAAIYVDDHHALMTKESFYGLCEYSTSIPTGKYPGKMWRARRTGGWVLCWYEDGGEKGYLDIQIRPITVAVE